MLKKIRRMLMLQGLLWSVASWFAWKHRAAIERSARAARAAWYEVGSDSAPVEQIVVVTPAAAMVPPDVANW